MTIQQYADYEAAGFVLDVGLYVTCKGNGTVAHNGLVNVTVEQYPPQTPFPLGFGSGPQPVVCDGTAACRRRHHRRGGIRRGPGKGHGDADPRSWVAAVA